MVAAALLLESVHANATQELEAVGAEVVRHSGALDEDGLIAALSELMGAGRPLMVGLRSKTKLTGRVFDEIPDLALVGAFCIGTDQIDLARATQGGVAVFNAPFSSTRSVAELVLGELIMLSRQVFPRSMAAHRGQWAKTAKGAHEVRGKTLGIVGYGHIGSQLSVLAEGVGLNVIYYDVVGKLPLGNATAVESLDELLAQSDFVSLHVPDTPNTRNMIGADALAKMQPHAYLVNASRGTVVDIDALRTALEGGALAGAAVDVYPVEPAKAGDPFDSPLRGLDNVILTPHVGGSTLEAQANIGTEVARALAACLTTGSTTGSVTLPQIEIGRRTRGVRLWNVHRNVPGVLSRVNQVVAESGLNIAGQQLQTAGEVGVLAVDLDLEPGDTRGDALCASIAALDASVRTRKLSLGA